MSEDEQPEGWVEANLFDISEPRQWPTISTKELTPTGYPVYGANGRIGFYKDFNHAEPTVLITCRGATCGTLNICEAHSYVTGNSMALDGIPPDGIDLNFLFAALQNRGLDDAVSGSAQPQITRANLRVVGLPIAPFAEQRRIVEKVEALLAQVNTARARLTKVPSILKRFRQSILSAACSGRLIEDSRREDGDWGKATVESVCEEIVDCPHSTPKWSHAGQVCLRTTNFTTRGLNLEATRYVDPTTFAKRTQRLRPCTGDIVYSREGTLGIACLIPDGLEACLGQRMMLMRPHQGRMTPRFLELALNSPDTLSMVKELTRGTTSPHLNVADVKTFEIPVPAIPEQHEIVRHVDTLFKLADAIEARVAAATARADRLTQAILAKAFRGELVPTEAELARQAGRDYEPASALLARIRAARAASAIVPKPRARSAGKVRPTSRRDRILRSR